LTSTIAPLDHDHAARGGLHGQPELIFRKLLLCDIAADEKMLVFRFRLDPGPSKGYNPAFLVAITGLEIADEPIAASRPHLCPGALEIIGVNELGGAAADQFFGRKAQDRDAARVHANEFSGPINDED
jgi:hypothetical protein